MMYIILFLLLLYTALILFYALRFLRYKDSFPTANSDIPISIVTAVKNESDHIEQFFESINSQSYNNLDVILVDDHSTDNTLYLIQHFSSIFPLRVLESNGNGKKAALAAALKYVETPYILFTDCDCIPSPDWAKCMIHTAIEQNADMVLAPVIIKAKNQKSLFQRLWQAESMSLITLTAASAITCRPLMCNGGNMLVSTYLRRQAEGHINNKYLSGDDIFLLQFAVSEHKKIVYAKSPSTTVSTCGPETLGALLRQRGRWVSKTGGYTDWFTILVALLVFAANISVIVGAVISAINGWWYIFIILWLLKFIADALSVRIPSAYYHLPVRWLDILALAVVYPFYTLACTVIGMTRKTVWR